MNSKKKQSKASQEASLIRSSAAEYLTFVAASGKGNVQAVYDNENVWLTQKMMGLLYDVETHTINYHLKKVFDDSELREDSVIRNFRITADDGKMVDLGSGSQREIELVQPPQRGQLRQPRASPWVFEPIIPSPERAT